MALLDVQNLTFSYPDSSAPALREVNLHIEPGEFVVICGRSGCGKSTLIRQFKSVLTPHGAKTGEVYYKGTPLHQVDLRTQAGEIGFVMQNPQQQLVTDKVWHEMAFGLENLGLELGDMRLRVAEMASYFGLQGWLDRKVEELSGGEQQLLNLASVMAMHPQVLVLDEPTSQLDPMAATDFLHTLQRLNQQLGLTVVVVEHRLDQVFPMADRVVVLEEGKVLCDGSPRQVGQALAHHPLGVCCPVPMQIYSRVEGGEACPMTVKEGRTWLEQYRDKPQPPMEPHTQPAPRDFALEAREVWFRYDRHGADVLQGLNLQVPRGQLYALMGGNGGGKTTALSLFSGEHRPYRGQIRIGGQVRKRGMSLERGVLGVLPQNPQCLFVRDTVGADLGELLDELPLSRSEREERLAQAVRVTQLEGLLGQHPYDLSGGEQQRAALAKVLLLDPEILLLDEPTKGLDGCYKQTLAQVLRALTGQGKTVFMVSHDVEFCAAYAHTCGLLFRGQLVCQKPARDFFLGNHFYTTAANQMAREVFPQAVTVEDVVWACTQDK